MLYIYMYLLVRMSNLTYHALIYFDIRLGGIYSYHISVYEDIKLYFGSTMSLVLPWNVPIDFVFCYIAIISDKNTYHYNSKVLCRVTRVSNSLDKFVWLIGWLGIEKSGQIINHCHNAYQYHDEIRRISLKYMILSSIIKYQTMLKRFS